MQPPFDEESDDDDIHDEDPIETGGEDGNEKDIEFKLGNEEEMGDEENGDDDDEDPTYVRFHFTTGFNYLGLGC